MMYLISVLCACLAVFAPQQGEEGVGLITAEKILAIDDITKSAATDMNSAVMLILAFCFAAPYRGDVTKALGAKKEKKAGLSPPALLPRASS